MPFVCCVGISHCPGRCQILEMCLPPVCGPACCSHWEKRRAIEANGFSDVEDVPFSTPMPRLNRSLTGAKRLSHLNLTSRSIFPFECTRKRKSKRRNCAQLWSSRPRKRAHPVALVTMFKMVQPRAIVQFLEYHFLMGVSKAFIVDNNCGEWAKLTQIVVAPYVRAGLVKLITQFNCVDVEAVLRTRGSMSGSSPAIQLLGMRGVPAGALIVGLDADEFFVMKNVSIDLKDLANDMYAKHVCAVQMLWKVNCCTR